MRPAASTRPSRSGRTQGVYARIKLLDHLPQSYTCIVFDRRECGQSGGRVERVGWATTRRRARACSTISASSAPTSWAAAWACPRALAFGVALPGGDAQPGAVLAGRRRQIPHRQPPALRRASRLSCSRTASPRSSRWPRRAARSFGADPRGGPWASVLRHDRAFAEAYAKQDVERYKLIVAGMGRSARRPRHRAGRRAGGSAPPRHPGPDRAGPRRLARHLGGALPGGVPAARGVLGRAGRGADGGERDASARAGVPGSGERATAIALVPWRLPGCFSVAQLPNAYACGLDPRRNAQANRSAHRAWPRALFRPRLAKASAIGIARDRTYSAVQLGVQARRSPCRTSKGPAPLERPRPEHRHRSSRALRFAPKQLRAQPIGVRPPHRPENFRWPGSASRGARMHLFGPSMSRA